MTFGLVLIQIALFTLGACAAAPDDYWHIPRRVYAVGLLVVLITGLVLKELGI